MALSNRPSPAVRRRARATLRVAPASSLNRMLGLLDLFTVHAPVWRSDNISRRLGYTRPTVYRYLKYLCDAGLLMGIGGSAFCLGPRIVQLEQQIQLTDPVLAAGRLILPKTLVSSSWHLLLLCSFCQNSVLCIHQEVRQSKLGRMLQTKIKRPRCRCSGGRHLWRSWPSSTRIGAARFTSATRRRSGRQVWAAIGGNFENS